MGGFRRYFPIFAGLENIVFISMLVQAHMVQMTGVSGFCLKCKTYGPIKDGKMIRMSNGHAMCWILFATRVHRKNFENCILTFHTDSDIYRIIVEQLRGLVV